MKPDDKPRRCEQCKSALQLPEYRECARIECPHRKPLTAQPPQHLDAGRVPARINDNH